MKKCFDCGHEHPTMASASRRVAGFEEWEERFFCHENDHSCYQDRYGMYWTDMIRSPLDIVIDSVEKLKREAREA